MASGRICFSVPMAQPVFEPEFPGPFGGSEVRARIFATGLAALGWEVHLLVQTHQRRPSREVSGVLLHDVPLPPPIPRCRDAHGWQRLLRTPWTMGRRLARSLKKRYESPALSAAARWDAAQRSLPIDVVACFGVHAHAAQVVRTARDQGYPSILFLASDTDLSDDYRAGSAKLNAYGQRADLCYLALQEATQIIAQTEAQRNLLASRFGREAVRIRNPIPPLSEPIRQRGGSIKTHATSTRRSVLWIGRADCFSKRADLAIELARSCPELDFTLVMNRRDQRVYDELVARVPGHARVVPSVPPDEMAEWISTHDLLLNTSDAEGFPNTFLQAAQLGVPIFSLRVDPDGMLARGAGWCAQGDGAALVRTLKAFSPDSPDWLAVRAAGPHLIRSEHDAAGRCEELAALLQDVRAHFRSPSQPLVPADRPWRGSAA